MESQQIKTSIAAGSDDPAQSRDRRKGPVQYFNSDSWAIRSDHTHLAGPAFLLQGQFQPVPQRLAALTEHRYQPQTQPRPQGAVALTPETQVTILPQSLPAAGHLEGFIEEMGVKFRGKVG